MSESDIGGKDRTMAPKRKSPFSATQIPPSQNPLGIMLGGAAPLRRNLSVEVPNWISGGTSTPGGASVGQAYKPPTVAAEITKTPQGAGAVAPLDTATIPTALAGGGTKKPSADDIAMLLAQGAQAVMGGFQNSPFAQLGATVEKNITQSQFQDAMARALAGEDLTKEDFQKLSPEMVTEIADTKRNLEQSRLSKSEAVLKMLKQVSDLLPGSEPNVAGYRLPMMRAILEQAGISVEQLPGIEQAVGAQDAAQLEATRRKAEAEQARTAELNRMRLSFGQDVAKTLLAMGVPEGLDELVSQKVISPETAEAAKSLAGQMQAADAEKSKILLATKIADTALGGSDSMVDTNTRQALLRKVLESLGVELKGALAPQEQTDDLGAFITNLAK